MSITAPMEIGQCLRIVEPLRITFAGRGGSGNPGEGPEADTRSSEPEAIGNNMGVQIHFPDDGISYIETETTAIKASNVTVHLLISFTALLMSVIPLQFPPDGVAPLHALSGPRQDLAKAWLSCWGHRMSGFARRLRLRWGGRAVSARLGSQANSTIDGYRSGLPWPRPRHVPSPSR